MRLALLGSVVLAMLTLAGSAAAAPPVVSAAASPSSGVGPLAVTLTASGEAATYTWALGDGNSAAGATVRHVYAPGTYVARVTATGPAGETSTAQVQVVVRTRTVALAAPALADYEDRVRLTGIQSSAVPGSRVQIYRGRIFVTSARVGANGSFRAALLLRSAGPYQARYGAARSAERLIRIRPRLVTTVTSTAPTGGTVAVSARLVPTSAGVLTVEIRRGSKLVTRKSRPGSVALRVAAGEAGSLRVGIVSRPKAGFVAARRQLRASIVSPSLSLGSRGASVLALERRLSELRYALRGVDTVYGVDTLEAVIAFQKVNGLARNGRVDAALWKRLAVAMTPMPRAGGADHIEVDKTRQVLFEVKGGQITRIVHVSTGATGNTPLGTWHVYRKVSGFDWVLWYPMYFLRGFAIHGYPSVPAYPASHGCVRVPMWIAPVLFSGHDDGTTITIYL